MVKRIASKRNTEDLILTVTVFVNYNDTTIFSALYSKDLLSSNSLVINYFYYTSFVEDSSLSKDVNGNIYIPEDVSGCFLEEYNYHLKGCINGNV